MARNECLFCRIVAAGTEAIDETGHFTILTEPAPVSRGHLLIVSKRHIEDAFALSAGEWADLGRAIRIARDQTLTRHTPDGFNIGMNCGWAAGQSQMHFHAHVIPRYAGDVENPLGGVRNILGNNIPPKT